MASPATMSTTFKELAPAKIAEIKAELLALESASPEVQRYKLLCEDLRDWERALKPEGSEPALNSPAKFSQAWPSELMPQILEERGEPMTRKELKAAALARGVRTPGGDPDSDLDRFLSHSRNYAELVERDGKIHLPKWAIVGVLKQQEKPMNVDALMESILPEHTKNSKIRKRYEDNFRGKILKQAIADGLVVLERGKVVLKK
jgi:hypothetical protein